MLMIAKLQGNVLDMLIGLLRNMHTYAGLDVAMALLCRIGG